MNGNPLDLPPTVNGSQKHYLSYKYDANNNVIKRRQRFYDKGDTSWSESLSYDALNRLVYRDISVYDASYLPGNFQVDQNYRYDDWGNITYKAGVGNYYYDGSKKHRLVRTSGTRTYNFTYDANGNITADGTGRSFSYFSFDKVNRITKGSVYSEFEYAPAIIVTTDALNRELMPTTTWPMLAAMKKSTAQAAARRA